MSREWKPGAVYVITCATPPSGFPAVRDYKGWNSLDPGIGFASDDDVIDARPLVVIDPEDANDAERLCRLFVENGVWRTIPVDVTNPHVHRREQVQAALREMADPTPPKPEEPQDVGALVTASFEGGDGKGFGPALWAHCGDGSWVCLTDGYARLSTSWAFLTLDEATP